MPPGERHLASHAFNVAVLLVGCSALAWMLHHLGLGGMLELADDVGWSFALIMAIDLAGTCCDAAAIRAFMQPDAAAVSYGRVLVAQLAGRGVNLVTPGGALGEATKISMLVGHAPRDRVVSSIVLYNLATLYLSVALIVIGVPITLALVDVPHHVRIVIETALAVMLPLVIALGVVVHRGALATLVDGARSLRLLSGPRAEAWRARLAGIDGHLRELHVDRSSGTLRGLAFVCASRLCSWTATISVLVVLGVTLHAALLVGLFSVGVLIGWLSSVVPLGIGLADGGNYALFGMLGASGQRGLGLTLVGRARSLTIALLGLLVMALGHTTTRVMLARRRAAPP